MERKLTGSVEKIEVKDKISPEMAFVAIIDTNVGYNKEDRSWQERGACSIGDDAAFFPSLGESAKDAKRICGRCSVREICLEYALKHNIKDGIWGGMTVRERRRERALRSREKPAA